MMLTELRVRNYRTVGPEQTLRLPTGTTLVGPNNSGKTNLLRAVELFFTGYDNVAGYRRGTDLTFGVGTQRTSLVATFTMNGHGRDAEILALLDELHGLVGTTRESDSFSVNLYFTGEHDTAVYRVFGNIKVRFEADRVAFSRKQKQLVELLLGTFKSHYVPSAKSISGLYEDLLQPFLAEAAYLAIEPHMARVTGALDSVASSLNAELASVGLSEITSGFRIDANSPSRMLAAFELVLSDPGATPLAEKGQGIQSTALFASFAWITEQEAAAGLNSIWLIEEPESYLHPELTKSVFDLLANLATRALVVCTTHSLAFVPTAVEKVQGTALDGTPRRTAVSSFPTHADATARIRLALGVQFSDYYNLSKANIFVEGPSDRELIRWASPILDPLSTRFMTIDASLIEEFGGVKQLEGFLKATFDPIRKERALVSVFDGDTAGQKTRQDLQQYFGQKSIPFEPNRDFVSVRAGFAIEGLFPDEWIVQMHTDHSTWFDTYSVDSSGALEPFRISSGHKSQAIKFLQARAEAEGDLLWSTRWEAFLSSIENALVVQLVALGS